MQAVQQAATSASAAAKVLRAIVVKKQSGFAETATPSNVLRSLVTQSRRRMPQISRFFIFSQAVVTFRCWRLSSWSEARGSKCGGSCWFQWLWSFTSTFIIVLAILSRSLYIYIICFCGIIFWKFFAEFKTTMVLKCVTIGGPVHAKDKCQRYRRHNLVVQISPR